MPSPETRLSIRQQIFNAVKVRFQDIRQINGFATEVGKHCFAWRDLDKSPFTTTKTDDDGNIVGDTGELEDGGAINISDPERDPDDGVLSAHHQILTIEVIAAATAGGFTPPDNHARRIEADLLSAIGQDVRWGGLADDTLPGKSSLNVGHLGDRVAWVKLMFQIKFRTLRFNPYLRNNE